MACTTIAATERQRGRMSVTMLAIAGKPVGQPGREVRESWQREQFIAAMSLATTPVTVVATDGPAGRVGQTVSAMCSVSADPPTLLVCVHRRSPLWEAIEANGCFSVNLLSAGQAAVS